MAQHDYNIANQSFPSFRTDLNNVLSAINTSNSGTSRPSGAVAGTIWLDTTSATTPTLKFYDGSDDISLATLDYTSNTVNWLDSSVVADLVNDTTPQLGGDLDVNGNEIVSVSNGDIVLNPNGTGKAKVGTDVIKTSGKETIWIPAVAMYPNTTNGAEAVQVELTAGQPELKCLDFDASTDEKAQFSVAFPKSWNEGTVTFQAFFTANSTNTGNAIFTLAGVCSSDNDAINSAFGTAQSVTKAHSGTANDLNVSSESSAITISGTPTEGDQVFFQITRDADNGSDTLTADARLLGIKLFFTTDSANDS